MEETWTCRLYGSAYIGETGGGGAILKHQITRYDGREKEGVGRGRERERERGGERERERERDRQRMMRGGGVLKKGTLYKVSGTNKKIREGAGVPRLVPSKALAWPAG